MYGELKPLGGGAAIALPKTRLLIGRNQHCDIVLTFPQISGDHCELFLQDNYWHVRDLNSKNGTKVNGIRVTGEEVLEPGDTLSMGHYTYEISYAPSE